MSKQLQIQSLSGIRGERDLFYDLNFVVNPKELVQISGFNGCGKTTLLRMVAGLSGITSGNILWDGVAISEAEYNKDLIYIGHQTGIKNQFTALENLQFDRQLNNSNDKDLFEILANLSLSGFEDIPCFHLSAGQKRRVGLARLFASNCPLWILDEPFAALDKSGILYFEQACQTHLDNDGMIILTTHQPLQSISATVINLSDFSAIL